jgi:hypothetical protein
VTDREPDSTPTKYGDPPAASCAGSGLARGQQEGVACLRAVVDLTVKTNIRTARRGTLRGATTSPTMQAGIGGYQACEVLAARRSYVGDAKLDKMLPVGPGVGTIRGGDMLALVCLHDQRWLTRPRSAPSNFEYSIDRCNLPILNPD